MLRKPSNVFEAIMRLGHDEDFTPATEAEPTKHVPGSLAKIEVLDQRVARGQPLWHPDDKQDCSDASPDEVRRRQAPGVESQIRMIAMDDLLFGDDDDG